MNTDTLFTILTGYDCNISKISRVNKIWKEILYMPMPLHKKSFREIKRDEFILANSNQIKKDLISELERKIIMTLIMIKTGKII